MIKRYTPFIDDNDGNPYAKMAENPYGRYILAADVEKEYEVEISADATIVAEVTTSVTVNALSNDEAEEIARRGAENNEYDDEFRFGEDYDVNNVSDVRVLSVEEV